MEESECIGFCSIGINILLEGIKHGLAVFPGTIASAADAIYSLFDVISSVTVLVGIKISNMYRVNIHSRYIRQFERDTKR